MRSNKNNEKKIICSHDNCSRYLHCEHFEWHVSFCGNPQKDLVVNFESVNFLVWVALDDKQEASLIEIMVCCVKQAATGESPVGRGHGKQKVDYIWSFRSPLTWLRILLNVRASVRSFRELLRDITFCTIDVKFICFNLNMVYNMAVIMNTSKVALHWMCWKVKDWFSQV